MPPIPGPNPFRLTSVGEGRGVSCDVRGCYIDNEPLLTRSRDANGQETWTARPQAELEDALSARYGHPIDMSAKTDGLAAIADALNRGDVFRAQLGTLALKLPHPPAPGFANVLSPRVASLLHLSGMLRGGQAFPPDNSGQGRSRSGNDKGNSQTLARDPRVIPAQEFLFSEIPLDIPWARPTPPLLPWDFIRPRPGPIRPDMPRPVPPDWAVPIPREIPGVRKGQLVNPYPEKRKCAKEWAEAYQVCNKKFLAGEFKPGYGGFGADFERCVRGWVSPDCGGSKGESPGWKRPRPKIDLTPREKTIPPQKPEDPPITA
jgi:hypothetical protein